MRRLLFIGVIALLFSCNDFFVKDISETIVVLTSPADNVVTTQLTHTFIWEEVQRCDYYRLQIAYPSFSAIQYYVVDTLTYNQQFLITLSPGSYQWRVKAINSASETDYSEIRDLQIDTTSDLSNQTVALINPIANAYKNVALPSFSWQAMSIADSYNIIIKTGSNWNSGSIILNDTVSSANYTLSVGQELSEATYTWGIRAINSLSYTTNYSTRVLNIDLTNPPAVSLVAPAHNSLQSVGSISFSWQQSTDLGVLQSPRTDSFFVYSDTAMTTLLYSDALSFPNTTKTISNNGTYRWVVRSYDAAGNYSPLSLKFDFVVQ